MNWKTAILQNRVQIFLWISPGSEQVTDWHLSDFPIQMQHGGFSASGDGVVKIASHVQVESCNKIIWRINDSEIFTSSKTKMIVGWHSCTPIISKFIFMLGEL